MSACYRDGLVDLGCRVLPSHPARSLRVVIVFYVLLDPIRLMDKLDLHFDWEAVTTAFVNQLIEDALGRPGPTDLVVKELLSKLTRSDDINTLVLQPFREAVIGKVCFGDAGCGWIVVVCAGLQGCNVAVCLAVAPQVPIQSPGNPLPPPPPHRIPSCTCIMSYPRDDLQ
jgi:hypothetical protein